MREVIHLLETREQKQQRLGRQVPFRASARCGNGEPVERLVVTPCIDRVTCQACIDALTKQGGYCE